MRSKYIAGVCNIGHTEVMKRLWQGVLSFAITISYIAFLSFFTFDKPYLLFIFFPITATELYLIQAKFQFCFRYGFGRRYNFSNDTTSYYKVSNESDHKKDIRRSYQILSYASLASAVTTLFIYALIL